MAANIFTGATDSNWGTATNWSTGAVPTGADGNVATFDASSPDCTVNSSNRVCHYLDMSAYANKISGDTANRMLSVYSTVTLGASMDNDSLSLSIRNTCTITFNTYEWKGTVIFGLGGAGITYTLADDIAMYTWTQINGSSTFTGTKNIYIRNNITCETSCFSANCVCNLIGVNQTINASTGYGFIIPIVMNISGTLTITNTTVGTGVTHLHSFTETAGTIDDSGCRVWFSSNAAITAGATLDTSHKWNSIIVGSSVGGSTSVTLNDTLNASTLQIGGSDGSTSMIGTDGFNVDNLVLNLIGSGYYTGRYIALKSGNTYVVNTSIVVNSNTDWKYNRMMFISTTATSSAILNLGVNCWMDVSGIQITDIDCSGGKTMKVLRASLTRTTNITNYTTWYFADELPAVADVKTGTTYGDARGTVFTGTLASGGGAMAIMT